MINDADTRTSCRKASSARSWAFDTDVGSLYAYKEGAWNLIADEDDYDTRWRWELGDTIGAGFDSHRSVGWFTRNGKRLPHVEELENVRGRFFPALGINDRIEVVTNFAGPSMWLADRDLPSRPSSPGSARSSSPARSDTDRSEVRSRAISPTLPPMSPMLDIVNDRAAVNENTEEGAHTEGNISAEIPNTTNGDV